MVIATNSRVESLGALGLSLRKLIMSTDKLARIAMALTFAVLTACASGTPQRDESIMYRTAPVIESAPVPVLVIPDVKNPSVGEVRVEKLDAPSAKKKKPVAEKRRSRRRMNSTRFIEANEENLLFVFVSMPKKRVTSVLNAYRAPGWSNPCKEERRVDKDGEIYEIYFYLTRKPSPPRRTGERVMTPIVFANGRVASIGRYALKKLRARTRLVGQKMASCAKV